MQQVYFFNRATGGLALDASTEVHIRGAVLDAWGHLEGCQDGVESNEVLVLDLRKT